MLRGTRGCTHKSPRFASYCIIRGPTGSIRTLGTPLGLGGKGSQPPGSGRTQAGRELDVSVLRALGGESSDGSEMNQDHMDELMALRQRVAELERMLAESKGASQCGEDRSAHAASLILANAPDAIVTSDQNHRVIEWNPGAERLFGYSREEMLGRRVDGLITNPETYEQAVQFTRLVGRRQRIPPVNVVRYRKDGTPVNVILSAAPILSGDKLVGTVVIYTDITDRVQAERQEEQRTRELASLSKAAEELVELPSEDNVYQVIAERMREMVGEQAIAVVSSYEQSTHALCVRAIAGDGLAVEAALKVLGQNPLGASVRIPGGARARLTLGKIVELDQGLYELGFGKVPRMVCEAIERLLGIERLYAVGFSHREELLGNVTIFLGRGVKPEDWTPLETFANQASVALQRKRDQAIQSVLYRISQAVSVPGTLPQFLRVVHQELNTLMDTANFYVALYDPERDLYSFPYSVDPDDVSGNIAPQQLKQSLTDYVRRTGTPLLVDEELHEELMRQGEVGLVGTPSRLWLAVPLKTAQEVIGVLSVQSYDDPQAFTESDLRLLELVAPQVAAAIEHKRAEDALRESEELYHTLVATSPDAIVMSDLEGKIVSASPRAVEMHGCETAEELLGKNSLELIAPEEHERTLRNLRKTLHEGAVRGVEYTMLRRDGSRFIGELNAALIKDAQGQARAFIATVRDVTERKQLEEQLRQAQKMEAVGRLAGGIAHDFNNLLTVINGYSQMLLGVLNPDSELRPDLEAILHAGERAADLTRQLLAFSRRQILEMRTLDPNEVIEGMAKMLHRVIGEDISLSLRLAEDLGSVRADQGQLEQVVVNLAVNGRDAMPDGGTLTLETANVEIKGVLATRHMELKPGPYVLLAVSDTGQGMSQEVKEHLFEPFFTTKVVGQGTGLGLATVYGIVKQSGGDISVYSELGHGTTFRIYLPRVEGAKGLQAGAHATTSVPTGQETILLVEDEDEVRQLAALALRKLGYTVLEVQGGPDAMQLFQAQPEAIHMVLTDVVMPGMSGKEMVDRLQQMRQGFRVLYMSGYTDEAIVHRGVLEPGIPFIQKPFTLEALAAKVRKVLDAHD